MKATEKKKGEGEGPLQRCLQGVSKSRNRSARAELRKPALFPSLPSLPSLPRERTRQRFCLAFSYFFPPFPFLFFPFTLLPPLSPFPLEDASPGQGQSRSHPPPLPGPRRPMARGNPLPTRALAAAVGRVGPAVAAAASGPGESWN